MNSKLLKLMLSLFIIALVLASLLAILLVARSSELNPGTLKTPTGELISLVVVPTMFPQVATTTISTQATKINTTSPGLPKEEKPTSSPVPIVGSSSTSMLITSTITASNQDVTVSKAFLPDPTIPISLPTVSPDFYLKLPVTQTPRPTPSVVLTSTRALEFTPNVTLDPKLLTEVVRGKPGRKQVAITIDGGGDSQPFPKLITGLNQTGIKLTFFLTGQWAQQNPQFVQQIVQSGHEIANHSWSHPDFTSLTADQIKSEMERTEALLTKFTGKTTKPLMRFPFGARNQGILQVVTRLGYRSIFWTFDSQDSIGEPKSTKFLFDRITKQTDAQLDGQIILMHILNSTTAEALPLIIKNLQERGFGLVTVSKLLE